MRLALKQSYQKQQVIGRMFDTFLKKYLEKKFKKKRNWKNQGKIGWLVTLTFSKFDLKTDQ